MQALIPTAKDITTLRSKDKYDSLPPAIRRYIWRLIECDGNLLKAAEDCDITKEVANSIAAPDDTKSLQQAMDYCGLNELFLTQVLATCIDAQERRPTGAGKVITTTNMSARMKALALAFKLKGIGEEKEVDSGSLDGIDL